VIYWLYTETNNCKKYSVSSAYEFSPLRKTQDLYSYSISFPSKACQYFVFYFFLMPRVFDESIEFHKMVHIALHTNTGSGTRTRFDCATEQTCTNLN
jgi:hypothetical protein